MTVDLLSAALSCRFTDDLGNNVKSCSIGYSPIATEMCDNTDILGKNIISNTTATSDSVVVISLPVLSKSTGEEYCYVATASNGTFTAMVKGTFSTGI